MRMIIVFLCLFNGLCLAGHWPDALLEKANEPLIEALENATGEYYDPFELRHQEWHVYVLLKKGEEFSKVRTRELVASEEGRQYLRRAVSQAQDTVLSKAPEGMFMRNAFNLIHGFSAICNLEALATLAEYDEVERLELMPTWKRDDTEGNMLTGADVAHTNPGVTGDGVTIAFIDDAFDMDHPYYSARWVGAQDFVGTDPNDVNPDCGQTHGTNTMGTAAADFDDGFLEVRGSAPGASVMGLKVWGNNGFGCGSSLNQFLADMAAAVDWAANNAANIDILSMSMSIDEFYDIACNNMTAHNAVETAFQNANAAGLIVFSSTSNDGLGDGIAFPSCLQEVISVGAVYDANIGARFWLPCTDNATAADQVACYSNSAPVLDILAPGNDTTTSTVPVGPTFHTTTFGGTSAATPYAAGVAALLLETDPTLTHDEMRAILSITGVPIIDDKNGLIKPRVDVLQALEALPPTSQFDGNDPRFAIIIDRSGSMMNDPPPGIATRCESAINMAIAEVQNQFLTFPNTRVKVYTFQGSTVTPLTANFETEANVIAALQGLLGVNCGGATPLADAACTAAADLVADFPNPALITRVLSVYTDGIENNSSGACAGTVDNVDDDPPYTLNSWENLVFTALENDAIVNVRFWGDITKRSLAAEGGDPMPPESAAKAATLDDFFRAITYATGGGYTTIPDGSALPPAPNPVPQRPDASCRTAVLNLNSSGNGVLTAAMVDNGSSDSDGFIASRSIDRNSFDCSDIGYQAVQLTVTDNEGITDICYATVDVRDITPPSIDCPSDLEVTSRFLAPLPRTDSRFSAFFSGSSASDVCDPNPDIRDDAPNDLSMGANTVTFTAEDDSGNQTSCTAQVTLSPPPFALYATESVNLNQGVVVNGPVGAGNGQGQLNVVVGNYVTVNGDVFGDHIFLKQGGEIHGVASYNNLDAHQYSTITEGHRSPITVPLAGPSMALPSINPGTTNVWQSGPTTLAPGSYGTIQLNTYWNNPTVVSLQAGVYHIRRLHLSEYTRIECLGPVELRVAETVYLARDADLVPAPGLGPESLQVFAAGSGGYIVAIGERSEFAGHVVAPNGTIFIDRYVTTQGRFYGRRINVGVFTNITLDPSSPKRRMALFQP